MAMNVLAADDDEMMRMLVGALLEQAGHQPELLADGASAWESWERGRQRLVILDWQMPRLDGLEVCRRIRAADPDRETFLLMVTARDSSDDLVSVLDAGADDYVSKPLTPNVFLTRLRIAERRIAIEEARRTAEQALKDAKYMAGIGETAIALQHEINNPLAALMSTVSLLERGLFKPSETGEALTVVVEQANRIATVVRRLRDLTNPRSVVYAQGARMLDLSGETPSSP